MSRIATRILLATLALSAVVTASVTGGADAGPMPSLDHTSKVVVRPVTSTGTAAAGYTVTHQSGSISCDGQSVSAVDAGIDTCFPSAYYAPSC